jgi:hypothetical protein
MLVTVGAPCSAHPGTQQHKHTVGIYDICRDTAA